MNYSELLALDKELLIAKYTEVFGSAPEEGMGKQSMASTINNKLKESSEEDQSGDNSKEGDGDSSDTLDDKKGSDNKENDDENEDLEDEEKHDPAKDQKLPKTVQVKTTTPIASGMPSSKVVDLVKTNAKGKIIDKMQLTEAAYNNLPSSHKAEWKIKTPEEVQ